MGNRSELQRNNRDFESTYPLHDGAGLVRIVLALADRLAGRSRRQAIAHVQADTGGDHTGPTPVSDRAGLEGDMRLHSAQQTAQQ